MASPERSDPALSPYERALGPAAAARLHPRLRSYFRALTAAEVGVGHGVFRTAGCPAGQGRVRILRPLLFPLLRWLQRRGVVFAGHEHHVPFRVENRTHAGATHARRAFHLLSGDWTMQDAVSFSGKTPAAGTESSPAGNLAPAPAPAAEATPGPAAHAGPAAHVRPVRHAGPGVLIDELGGPGMLRAAFHAFEHGGALHLRSLALWVRPLRSGRGWIRIPQLIAPVVRLREEFAEAADRQRVTLTVDAPVVGRIYGYEGTFEYEIRSEAHPPHTDASHGCPS